MSINMSTTSFSSSSPIGSMFRNPINVRALLKANDITLDVQRHLVNVYAALAATILACAVGGAIDLYAHVGGFMTAIIGMLTLVWLKMEHGQTNYTKKIGILLLFGFLQGLSLGSLIDLVLVVDPSILVTALLATTTIFVCFAGAALFAKRRSYLYLGGVLSSALTIALMASMANLFLRIPFMFGVQLYAGLAVFCGFVVFDTQLMIEKASLGDRNFAWHAVELFIDFVAIFVRVCVILLRNRSDRDSGKERRKTSRR